MKKWLILVLILSCPIGIFSESNGVTLHISEYVEQFLSHSLEMDDAMENAEQALETLENARLSQESAYDIGLLENEYNLRQAELLSTENAAIVLAFELVFTSIASGNSLAFAKDAEKISAAEYKRAEELFRKAYISSLQERTAHIAHLQASSNARLATDGYSAAQKALIRPLEQNWESLEVEKFDKSVSVPEIPSTEWTINQDAYVVKLRADLSLYKERRYFLRESQAGPPAELDAIDDTIEDTAQLLQQRIWFLQDSLEQLHSQIEANNQEALIAGLNAEIQLMSLQQTRYQYDNGDIYPSDVAQAELTHSLAIEQIAALERDLVLLTLETFSIRNESIKQWVGGRWASE